MHWKQQSLDRRSKPVVRDKSAVILARQVRRERAVVLAIEEARAGGCPDPTADAIAAKCEQPIGLVRWMLPRIIVKPQDA